MDYATGGANYYAAVGDVNGDGNPDVVAVSGSGISVFLGIGNGAFAAGPPILVGHAPFAVALADFNNDGRLDVAAASEDGTFTILLGNGDGTFQVGASLASGGATVYALATDLNGDGKPDLVLGNYSSSVAVLLGNGDGTFGARQDISVVGTWTIAAGDLNGDGKVDLVAAGGYGGVSVLLGHGDGTFARNDVSAAGPDAHGVTLGDFNGDGKQDLAVTEYGPSVVRVFLGNGDGTFGPNTSYSTGPYPTGIAAASLDADAHLDLVIANQGGNTVSVLIGLGDGTFASKMDFGAADQPWSVAVANLNHDPAPDLVVGCVNVGVSVLIAVYDGRATSATSLVATPNPSAFGQVVTLEATVTPSEATGSVSFTDGTTLLGSASLAAGKASIGVSELPAGSHTLSATYSGDPSLKPSTGGCVLTVNGVGTATAVSSSKNPSLFMEPVHFNASVSVDPPGAGNPSGAIQFTVDGVNFGSAVVLTNRAAASVATDTLTSGTHIVTATYSGDANFGSSASPPLTQEVQPSNPVIAGVRDAPNDQGGQVFVTWNSPLDEPGRRVVTGYRVWRRAPNPAPGTVVLGSDGIPLGQGGRGMRASRRHDATLEGYWQAIATLPAEQLVTYAYEAPTIQDSMAGSNPYTAFFVTALTADPFVFLQSAPDSGYSVDNLAPPTPTPFAAVYEIHATALHWGVSSAPDLGEFQLFRGGSPDFVPGPSNLVVATRDTGFVDAAATAYVYKLAAVDIHGNFSRYAVVTPNGPVATLASLVAVDAQPDRVRLTWYTAGNPGLVATVYRRTDNTDWMSLGQVWADGVGYLRYEDTAIKVGTRYGYRLGIMDGGAEVFVGEGWATPEPLVLALDGARPNPAVGGALKVAFSLPNGDAAKLELIDVGGRQLVARDISSLGPGSHSLDLGEGTRIPPGIYLLRLTEDGRQLTRRVAVLP